MIQIIHFFGHLPWDTVFWTVQSLRPEEKSPSLFRTTILTTLQYKTLLLYIVQQYKSEPLQKYTFVQKSSYRHLIKSSNIRMGRLLNPSVVVVVLCLVLHQYASIPNVLSKKLQQLKQHIEKLLLESDSLQISSCFGRCFASSYVFLNIRLRKTLFFSSVANYFFVAWLNGIFHQKLNYESCHVS